MKLGPTLVALTFGTLFGSMAWVGCGGDDSTVTPGVDAGKDSTAANDAAADNNVPADSGGSDAPTDAGAGTQYSATLNGNNEVPPVITTATGTATFTLSADKKKLTYHVTHNVQNGTAAHIHLGYAYQPGGVVVPLAPFSQDMSGTIDMTQIPNTTPDNQAAADALENGRWYVNVHSGTDAGVNGEIRGQIVHPGESIYVANLTPGQEVQATPVTSSSKGHAVVILDAAKTTVRYHLDTTATPTAAHIHRGIGGVSGPVVKPFPNNNQVQDGTFSMSSADSTDLEEGHFYVNVHTTQFNGGELRGQLIRPGEILYTAVLNGAGEVPPNPATANNGGAQFLLDPNALSFRYEALFFSDNAGTALAVTASNVLNVNGASTTQLYALTLNAAKTAAKGTQQTSNTDLAVFNGGNAYVDVQTSVATGNIRGQVNKQ